MSQILLRGGGNNSKVVLKVVDDAGGGGDTPTPDPNPKPETFSVTVPTTINISMGLSGKITVPSNLEIINNNDSGIKLTNVDVQVVGDWTAVDFDTTEAPVVDEVSGDNIKTISFAFRGDKMNSQGLIDVTPESWNFAPTSALPLNTKVRIPKQSTATEVDIANINWEFDWSDSDVSSDPSIGADIDAPTEEKVTVTFIEPEGVTIKGSKTLELKVGEKLTFPEVQLNGIRYEVENWIDNDTKEALSSDYVVTKNTTVSLTLKEKAENPKNWFTASGNILTGLSDEYLNMVDAPTELIIPKSIGGSTIKSIGTKAFANKDLIQSVVVPDTVTKIESDAFTGCSKDLKVDISYTWPQSIGGSPWGNARSQLIWGPREPWDTEPITSDELTKRGLAVNPSTPWYIYVKSDPGDIEELRIPSSVTINRQAYKVQYLQVDKSSTQDTFVNNSVKSIVLPPTIEFIGSTVFGNLKAVTDINIPDSVTKIYNSAFAGMESLKEVRVPNSVTYIDKYAFGWWQTVFYSGSYTANSPWGAKEILPND